jgi:hypothetical protein
MSSLVQHAKRELRAAGLYDADADYNGDVAVLTTSLMEVFVAYGHSGGSAEKTLDVFERLARGKPLSPLTGEDDEWVTADQVTDSKVFVNKRYCCVFKDDTWAWDVTNPDVAITFPHTVE